MTWRSALGVAVFAFLEAASFAQQSRASRVMADGKEWTIANLDIAIRGSQCYGDAEEQCRRYGRLYTWGAAQQGCRSLGEGWRLPTDDEWRRLAKHYGGVREDSADTGKAAYAALLNGGSSGFEAVMGGSLTPDGTYSRLDEHGFYWSSSETTPGTASFYNFGKGGLSLNRHTGGAKEMAVSVRCVKD
jgi:uncharacterized protein (TIGR02145 family)